MGQGAGGEARGMGMLAEASMPFLIGISSLLTAPITFFLGAGNRKYSVAQSLPYGCFKVGLKMFF